MLLVTLFTGSKLEGKAEIFFENISANRIAVRRCLMMLWITGTEICGY
jgi:hypothetical protein